MKRMRTIFLLSATMIQAISQSSMALSQNEEDKNDKSSEKKEVVIGRNFVKITEDENSFNIRVGNRGLSILESLEGEGTNIRLERYNRNNGNSDRYRDADEFDQEPDTIDYNYEFENDYNEDDNEFDYDDNDYDNDDHDYDNDNDENDYSRLRRRRDSFRGHWAAVELGFNNYTSSRDEHYIPDEIGYMDLHSGKSNNFNINFAQLNIGIGRHFGFVTGLGLNWNNYRFDGNNNIVKGTNGEIEILDPGVILKKSKLTTTYLTVPFLLEIQIPANSNHLDIAAGPIGAVKLMSHSKMVFDDNHKIKSNSDFNLNILRYGGTVRVGYSNLQLFGTYYFTPLFREGKGPGGFDLYPFEVGLAFSFND
jgi:hypothetical protein